MNKEQLEIRRCRFWANREGITLNCRVRGRWTLCLRVTWQNAWVGWRWTDFRPFRMVRILSVQILPFVALQIVHDTTPRMRA